MTNHPNRRKLIIGSRVAFNNLPDATWYVVEAINGHMLTVRETGTHDGMPYAAQDADKSLVVQVRNGEADK